MRRWFTILAVILLSAGFVAQVLAQTGPVTPETSAGGPVLGSVTNGNTTVVFEAANPSDIETRPLTIWDDFAAEHPEIARALAFKPSLMNDPRYLKRHPELNDFFEGHREVRDAMAADPGNFAAIPPRPGE
jgi:hypothetical protein